ncbi:tetratricopeptide repeat (TPR)-like superfamily protein [Actinidia rufa]|uniref:Tetratricopeptide repeat (TPR)-like superfamily protein n=1 Tax=Actinidia rufa TaxID=165716 RepID=A0A7J0EM93_9ERIC|nr:tetratricopeptide repeat (TPR)-like superfamily protein [Actinidia rufa]
MSLRGVSMNMVGFGVFIWRFCRNSEVAETLSLLDEVKKGVSEMNGSVIAVLIVHGLCLQSRVVDAFWVLDELRKRDCKPDFIAYRIVAEQFRSMGSVVDVEVVLKEKRKLGVAPRANDYREFILISTNQLSLFCNVVFQVHAGKGILSIKGYFSDMERYNVMVSFLCKAGKVKEAFEVLQEMKKKGLCLDVSFYNYLMEACCREELLRPAKRLWDEMFASGCNGNLKTYNILIRKFSDKGQVEESQRLFSHMLDKGIVPDTMTYTSLLEDFVKRTRLKMLLKSSKSPLNMIPC